ncbi:hypothetical protein [Anaerofustis stercorihominis]|uniref:Class I SAM-dependent methyltransferase n=1 Tax=Anaerofustis stercorihominis TaxID=214853 RepID=A0A3E3DZ59_9FIRM|nr:hypothetical protein [Anaerofustis stercorihominis]RGD74562.1 hypothetical protein DW687_07340 [Anaerofustis stercorihominis]
MIKIEDYLNNIYKDFKSYIDGGNNLCELKKLNYQSDEIPDYNNKYIQQLYLLRYSFSYAFEYLTMFHNIFKINEKLGYNIDNNLNVTSFGCGSYIDYWSLISVINDNNVKFCVKYIGIDLVDWEYKIEQRENDKIIYVQDNITNYIKSNDIDSDIYIFPKSISEISIEDFCQNIKNCSVEKDVFHILISLRAKKENREKDIRKINLLIKTLKDSMCDYCIYKLTMDFTDSPKYRGIKHYNNSFNYPDKVKNFLSTDLKKYCKCSEGDLYKNTVCDGIKRKPTLTTSQINYEIITFEKFN